MAERDRRAIRERRENDARRRARKALDRDEVRAVMKAAAGSREIDREAVEAVSALVEERIARIAARAVEAAEDRNEDVIRAAAVAVAAERDSEARRSSER